MDSFINKLTEGTTIKDTDYTVFDVANTTTGSFNTQKISYSSLTKQLSNDITAGVKTLINSLETKINNTNTTSDGKLDKKGLSLNANEKMSGTLSVLTLCAANIAYFNNNIDMKNNFISNVKDPVLDYDAVNKRSLTTAINNLNIPNSNTFLLKAGDAMTSGNLTLFAEPTIDKHATTKKYVDDKATAVSNSIPNVSNILSKYIPLAGGVMTGGFITQATEDPPADNRQLANKKYVDNQISTKTSNFVTSNSLGNYLPLAGGTMTGSLILKGFSEKNTSMSSAATTTLNLALGNTFKITLGANITSFTLTNEPTDSFSITLFIVQTGSFTINWVIGTTSIKWSDALKPSPTATGKVDAFAITKLGNEYYGFTGGVNFS